jgi:hypothetical protein
MRVIITASGIFSITERKASARLRGRSARLGLVMDLCLLRLQRSFEAVMHINRTAGSRLEVEIPESPDLAKLLGDLRAQLDEHSRRDLNGEVWFAIGCGASRAEAYRDLDERKLSVGKATLQPKGRWHLEKFVFDRWPSERALEDPAQADATKLPEAVLGRDLVDDQNRLIVFRRARSVPEEKLQVLDCVADVEKGRVYGGLCTALREEDGNTVQRAHKRLARYAPKDEKGFLLDLDKIADRATGAKFLGVLKADVDGLGEAFGELGEKESETLSDRLEALFTDQLESLIRSNEKYRDIYVVYSGGDDLFLLGPWDALIRFIDEFHSQLERSLRDARCSLTLSAGFKLAHPKSPVRFLADDVQLALDDAKGRRGAAPKLGAKNRIGVFERAVRWDELREGLEWADRFIAGAGTGADKLNLSVGLLQRLQYYADQFRRFFDAGKIDGLRAVPLLQDDWRRNVSRVKDPLKTQLTDEIQPKLTQLGDEGERMWRVVEFASRFAVYALR